MSYSVFAILHDLCIGYRYIDDCISLAFPSKSQCHLPFAASRRQKLGLEASSCEAAVGRWNSYTLLWILGAPIFMSMPQIEDL